MIPFPRIYMCITLFALSLTAIAQDFSISGKVVDDQSTPISYVTVLLSKSVVNNPDNSSGFGDPKGTITNDDGIFNFEDLEAGTYKIKVSFIGLETFEQIIQLTGNLDLKTIQLNESAESLGEVTIMGRKPKIIRKPDRLVFDVENTALTEGSTLGVLKSTPGVIVSDGGINIKSAPAAVYINNRKVQLTTNELIELLESAPANSIKSIEVITNPPASYDADSGSVINIIMSKNLVTGYRGSVSTNYTQGVFPRYNGGTSHYFKNEKINVNVNYNYINKKLNRNQDGTVNFFDNNEEIDQIWNSDSNRNTWSETHNLNLNFDYYIDEKNTLSITGTGLYTPYFKYKIKNIIDITDENEAVIGGFSADNLSRDNKYNIGSDLIFSHVFDNTASLTFNAHYTAYDYERDQSVLQDNFFDDNQDSEFSTLANQETQIATGKLDYKLPINENSTLDIGAKYSNVKTNSDITRLDIVNGQEVLNTANTDAFKYDESVLAAYTNYSKSWDKLSLNLGLRAEQTNVKGKSLTLLETNKQDYLDWFPNASLSYEISDDLSVKGNYKRSIVRPSYTDLNPFTFFLNENSLVLGNPNLVPTYLDHYVVGTSFLEHFTIEAYYINYDGDIVELPRQDNENNIVAFTPTNLDKKVDYGFDFVFDYYPTGTWNLYFVTSFYNVTEEANFGDGFEKINQWSNYSILQNSLSMLEDNSLNLNLTLTWVGKNVQQFQIIEDRLFSEFSITKTILNKKGVISLAVEDLFNLQDSETSLGYADQSNSRFIDVDNRFIKLGFRYKFGNTKLSTNERATSAEERDRLKDLN